MDDVDEYRASEIENEIVVLYSGYYTEIRHAGASRANALSASSSDRRKVSTWLDDLADDPAERKRIRKSLRRRTIRFLDEHWHLVEALASELLKHKELSENHADLYLEMVRARHRGDNDEAAGLRRALQWQVYDNLARVEASRT